MWCYQFEKNAEHVMTRVKSARKRRSKRAYLFYSAISEQAQIIVCVSEIARAFNWWRGARGLLWRVGGEGVGGGGDALK